MSDSVNFLRSSAIQNNTGAYQARRDAINLAKNGESSLIFGNSVSQNLGYSKELLSLENATWQTVQNSTGMSDKIFRMIAPDGNLTPERLAAYNTMADTNNDGVLNKDERENFDSTYSNENWAKQGQNTFKSWLSQINKYEQKISKADPDETKVDRPSIKKRADIPAQFDDKTEKTYKSINDKIDKLDAFLDEKPHKKISGKTHSATPVQVKLQEDSAKGKLTPEQLKSQHEKITSDDHETAKYYRAHPEELKEDQNSRNALDAEIMKQVNADRKAFKEKDPFDHSNEPSKWNQIKNEASKIWNYVAGSSETKTDETGKTYHIGGRSGRIYD